MNQSNVLKRIFLNTFHFSGRASRYDLSVYFLIFLVLSVVSLYSKYLSITNIDIIPIAKATYAIVFLYSIVGWTLFVRRLHDINKSGYYSFLAFTIIGIVPLFYFYFFKKSDISRNKYGDIPITSKNETFLSITVCSIIVLLTLSSYQLYTKNEEEQSSINEKLKETLDQFKEYDNWKYINQISEGVEIIKEEKLIKNETSFTYLVSFICFNDDLGLVIALLQNQKINGYSIPQQVKFNDKKLEISTITPKYLSNAELIIDKEDNFIELDLPKKYSIKKITSEPIKLIGKLNESNINLEVNLRELENSKVFEKCHVK